MSIQAPSRAGSVDALPDTLQDVLSLPIASSVTAFGWVKSIRRHKNISFISMNDGSAEKDVQLVIADPALLKNLHIGTSVKARGHLQESFGSEQQKEVSVASLEILGVCPQDTYPIQNQELSVDFLRSLPHLRTRTSRFSRILKLRSYLSKRFRHFLHQQQFIEISPPSLTFSDCEGGSEGFQISDGETFFGKSTFLSVSAQLYAEIAACSVGRAYCFGPIFRAERHNTVRHLSEFPMLEVEIPFIETVESLMDFTETMIKFVINDLEDGYCDPQRVSSLNASTGWPRITYQEAIYQLREASQNGRASFDHPIEDGMSLKLEHERFLACRGPVFVYNYPAPIKAFYMKSIARSPPDTLTTLSQNAVSCFDLLLPEVAEIVGGSLREDRLPFLEKSIELFGLDRANYEWYLDLRRFGSVPHGGFGIGVDRLLQYLTATDNIRDVALIPRYRGSSLC